MKMLDIPFADQIIYFQEDNYDNFRSVSPNGLVPLLKDGDQSIWDSFAIVEYLAEHHAGVWPQDPRARTWARCAAAEMHSGFATLRNICSMNVGIRARLHAVDRDLQRNIDRIDELFRQGLDEFGGPWLAGKKFTAVDAFYAPVAFRVRSFNLAISAQAKQWVDHILACEPMLQWEREALAETHREIHHEEEITAAATVIEDFRA